MARNGDQVATESAERRTQLFSQALKLLLGSRYGGPEWTLPPAPPEVSAAEDELLRAEATKDAERVLQTLMPRDAIDDSSMWVDQPNTKPGSPQTSVTSNEPPQKTSTTSPRPASSLRDASDGDTRPEDPESLPGTAPALVASSFSRKSGHSATSGRLTEDSCTLSAPSETSLGLPTLRVPITSPGSCFRREPRTLGAPVSTCAPPNPLSALPKRMVRDNTPPLQRAMLPVSADTRCCHARPVSPCVTSSGATTCTVNPCNLPTTVLPPVPKDNVALGPGIPTRTPRVVYPASLPHSAPHARSMPHASSLPSPATTTACGAGTCHAPYSADPSMIASVVSAIPIPQSVPCGTWSSTVVRPSEHLDTNSCTASQRNVESRSANQPAAHRIPGPSKPVCELPAHAAIGPPPRASSPPRSIKLPNKSPTIQEHVDALIHATFHPPSRDIPVISPQDESLVYPYEPYVPMQTSPHLMTTTHIATTSPPPTPHFSNQRAPAPQIPQCRSRTELHAVSPARVSLTYPYRSDAASENVAPRSLTGDRSPYLLPCEPVSALHYADEVRARSWQHAATLGLPDVRPVSVTHIPAHNLSGETVTPSFTARERPRTSLAHGQPRAPTGATMSRCSPERTGLAAVDHVPRSRNGPPTLEHQQARIGEPLLTFQSPGGASGPATRVESCGNALSPSSISRQTRSTSFVPCAPVPPYHVPGARSLGSHAAPLSFPSLGANVASPPYHAHASFEEPPQHTRFTGPWSSHHSPLRTTNEFVTRNHGFGDSIPSAAHRATALTMAESVRRSPSFSARVQSAALLTPAPTAAESVVPNMSFDDSIRLPPHRTPSLSRTESAAPNVSSCGFISSPVHRSFTLTRAESVTPRLGFNDSTRSPTLHTSILATDRAKSAPATARNVSFADAVPSPALRGPALKTDTGESVTQTSNCGKPATPMTHRVFASPRPTRKSEAPDHLPIPRSSLPVTATSQPSPVRFPPPYDPAQSSSGTPSRVDPRTLHPSTKPLRESINVAAENLSGPTRTDSLAPAQTSLADTNVRVFNSGSAHFSSASHPSPRQHPPSVAQVQSQSIAHSDTPSRVDPRALHPTTRPLRESINLTAENFSGPARATSVAPEQTSLADTNVRVFNSGGAHFSSASHPSPRQYPHSVAQVQSPSIAHSGPPSRVDPRARHPPTKSLQESTNVATENFSGASRADSVALAQPPFADTSVCVLNSGSARFSSASHPSPVHHPPSYTPVQSPSIAHSGTPSRVDPRVLHPSTKPLRESKHSAPEHLSGLTGTDSLAPAQTSSADTNVRVLNSSCERFSFASHPSPIHHPPSCTPVQSPSITHSGTPSRVDPRVRHPSTKPLRESISSAAENLSGVTRADSEAPAQTYMADANVRASNSGISHFTSVSQVTPARFVSQGELGQDVPKFGQNQPKFGAECSSLTNDVLVHSPPPHHVLSTANFPCSRWRTK